MTTMQSPRSDLDAAGHEPGQEAASVFDARFADAQRSRFGQQLRAAREARQLSLADCAQALRLSSRVLAKLEQGDHEGFDSRIYLASYMGTYGRHLGLDEASIQAEQSRLRQPEPPLVATGGISHSRYLFDRYRTAATYVVLTIAIVVPTIWLGVRSTLDRDLSRLTPLDASPVVQHDAPALAASQPAATPLAPAKPAAPAQEQPLMASMAPFPNLSDTPPAPVAATPTAPVAAGHSLSLTLPAASWVEVTAQDGTRLAYGLLPAGTSKTWHSEQPLDVRIGNAEGATASIDGQSVALDDYRHANVAHFRVQIADGKAAAADF